MARFVWNGLQKNAREWTRCCIACHTAKVHRHNKEPIGTFDAPDARFHDVYIDLVGPRSPSRRHHFLLTCVDRFTRCCEAIPLVDSYTEAVILAFLQNWFARFGAPKSVTIYRGPQFESALFAKLFEFLGCERIRRAAYHPAANGMVERLHRPLNFGHILPAVQLLLDTLPLATAVRVRLQIDELAHSAKSYNTESFRIRVIHFSLQHASLGIVTF